MEILMRAILVIVLLVVVLCLVGWVSFSNPDGDPSLRIDSTKVKEDTAAIVEKSKEALNNLSNKMDDNDDPQGVTE